MYVDVAAASERKLTRTDRVFAARFYGFFRFLHNTLLQLVCRGLLSVVPSRTLVNK